MRSGRVTHITARALRYGRAEAAARYRGLAAVEGDDQCLDGVGGRRLLRLRPSLLQHVRLVLLHAIVDFAAGSTFIFG